jgi:Zn-dependent peptidase ImmA (M78 family)
MLGTILATLIIIQQALAVQPLTHYEHDNKLMVEIFEDACRLSKYDCDGIEIPLVRRSSQLKSMDIYGLYTGGKTLWIDEQLMPVRAKLTMFHEAIHYLQVNVGGIEPDFMNRVGGCVIEREAMELSNAYARDILKMPQYVRTLENWKRTYRC